MKASKSSPNHLLYQLLNVSAKESDSIVYAPPLMSQFSLPTRDLRRNEFIRYNGQYKYIVLSPSGIGLPFGIYPRNILVYLATEVRLTQSQFVDLGLSCADFKKKLGVGVSAGETGPSNRFNDQFKRLFSCSIKAVRDNRESFESESHNLARKAYAVWKGAEGDSMSGVLELETSFYENLVTKSYPVDRRALKFFGRDCLAYDTYLWLTHRVYGLKRPVQIQWLQLQIQLGNQLASRNSFKYKFIKALAKIKLIWPELRVTENNRGILLNPCNPHVASERGGFCG